MKWLGLMLWKGEGGGEPDQQAEHWAIDTFSTVFSFEPLTMRKTEALDNVKRRALKL